MFFSINFKMLTVFSHFVLFQFDTIVAKRIINIHFLVTLQKK